MKHLLLFLSLVMVSASLSSVSAQQLELGGQIGSSSVATESPGSKAGLFAAFRGQDWRLGLRVELNYENHSQNPSLAQVPILATLPLDKQDMLELHAGPYLTQQAAAPHQPTFRFGFSTGLQVNLPLTKRLVLTTKGQADHDFRSDEVNQEARLVPARNLSFSISLGLAYRLLRGE